MLTAKDYAVTQGYGYDASYPLNGGFHKGIDYGCPTGTPVVVNGVTIGLSGATGAVTGPHLHVGRWVGGTSTDPGVGNGFSLSGAVVYDTGYDATNGNFVRISSAGALWVYLHLSKINVQAGQIIQSAGGVVMNNEAGAELYRAALHREAENSTVAGQWNGQTPAQALRAVRGAEWQIQDNMLKTLPAKIADMQKSIDSLSSRPTNAQYAKVQADLNDSITKLAAEHAALEAERNKPPVEVVKEVTKEVDPTWLTAVVNFLRKVLKING